MNKDLLVFDCNVYAQALVDLEGPAGSCVNSALQDRVELFLCSQIIQEIQELPQKKGGVKYGITESDVLSFTEELLGHARLIERTLGDQRAATDLPLQGISYDPQGSQAGDILVEVGDQGSAFETHLIHRPRAVRASNTQSGAELDIEIEPEQGPLTLVSLRPRTPLPNKGA